MRAESRAVFSARARKLMLRGVAVLQSVLGTLRDVRGEWELFPVDVPANVQARQARRVDEICAKTRRARLRCRRVATKTRSKQVISRSLRRS